MFSGNKANTKVPISLNFLKKIQQYSIGQEDSNETEKSCVN